MNEEDKNEEITQLCKILYNLSLFQVILVFRLTPKFEKDYLDLIQSSKPTYQAEDLVVLVIVC